ncbi:esterase-like activity of phytase family protein [Aureimonas sp. OT7]|uniref:esterase-like activity of phytase family protein n=1 Tax=Aureimonas sp. OT7 TaxID=2816454 RepID=UPI0017877A39|nr:esterase-like activity of phytase family protein [Aureimonas sp. OT7]QOG07449.1 esterase-like activity of phytase family protein [Aureimonas sp. OT7]
MKLARRIHRGLACCWLVLAAATSTQAQTPVALTPIAIETFLPGSTQTRFGALEYRGGFSFRPSERRLQGISGWRFTDAAGGRFLAVTDTGLWFAGTVLRDAAGVPIGIGDGRLAPIVDSSGRPQPRKGDADAEGLAIGQGRVLVSFERDHRVLAYEVGGALPGAVTAELDFHIPRRELRRNQGLEAIATAPDGRTVVVSEQSVDAEGNLFAAVLGPAGGVFKIVRNPPWHVTDGAFLPFGDLVLLERRYEGFGRIGMRLRRIAGGAIEPGALVDGDVLMEADGRFEIDNMEALDIFRDAGGEIVFAIASDDNGSFFQRNLYLEFRLASEDQARTPGASR